MKIFKPKPNLNPKTLDSESDFYKCSHGMLDVGQQEYTICGVACEEWNYVDIEPAKRITCPDCLAIIRDCKSYKL